MTENQVTGSFDVYGAGASKSQFETDIKRFVLSRLESDHDSIVTCPSLAAAFLDEFTESYGPLGLWNVAAYIGVSQCIRPLLRKKYDGDPAQVDLDLPETQLLQVRYSVPGASSDGEPAYVPRHMLTKEQMEAIVSRDRAMSAHFARRADALESWWYRTNAGGIQ